MSRVHTPEPAPEPGTDVDYNTAKVQAASLSRKSGQRVYIYETADWFSFGLKLPEGTKAVTAYRNGSEILPDLSDLTMEDLTAKQQQIMAKKAKAPKAPKAPAKKAAGKAPAGETFRTMIVFDLEGYNKAKAKAQKDGISFNAFVRAAVDKASA